MAARTPIDPDRADAVAAPLLELAAQQLGLAGLRFAEPPVPLGRGFDTMIYAFRLAGDGLPSAWTEALVARVYRSPEQAAKAAHEERVQRFAMAHGYPALAPLAMAGPEGPLGLPVMVMERVEGATLLERMMRNPLAAPGWLAAMGRAHAALHRLSVAGCPIDAEGPLVERRLAAAREAIARTDVAELRSGLDWLEGHKQAVSQEEPSLCHNDFHPSNILAGAGGRLTVIDWSDATVGDRHCDIARTMALFWFAPIAARSSGERLLLRSLRGFMRSRYVSAYVRELPVDARRLRYWEAAQAFAGWLQLTELAVRGAEAVGARRDAIERLPKGLVEQTRRYFWNRVRLAERLG